MLNVQELIFYITIARYLYKKTENFLTMPNELVYVVLDSSKRTSGTDENFSTTLIRPIKHIKKVLLTDLNFPLSYYNININNDTLEYEQPPDPIIHIASISIGNYDGTTLASAIEVAMNAITSGFTVSFDATTYKFTFTHIDVFILKNTSTIWPLLGFNAEDTLTIHISDKVVNLQSPKYIKIKSDVLGNSDQRLLLNQHDSTEDNTIYTLFPNSTFGCILVNNFMNRVLNYTNSFTITSIDLSLTDENDNPLLLNGNSWIISLQLTVR